MKEIVGDLFTQKDTDVICITTNGFVKKNGEGVMGRGVALEAKKRWPYLAKSLGWHINHYGNHVQQIDDSYSPYAILSFPVKHNWYEKADLKLIDRSCFELKRLMFKSNQSLTKKVILPRPGCGNGKLKWSEVKSILEKYFKDDDRIYIITNQRGKD